MAAKAAAAFRPDHGRAWPVLLAAFFICFLSLGNAFTLGVLFERIKQFAIAAAAVAVEQSEPAFSGNSSLTEAVPTRSSINFIFSINVAFAYLTGTVAAAVTAKLGHRFTVLIGGLCLCSGFALASLATQLWHLYLTLGALLGLGVGLVFTPSVGILAVCFDKYRHFATTFASTGVALGITTFSFVHNYISHKFPEWKQAMWIEALVATPLLLLALVMVEPKRPTGTGKPTKHAGNGLTQPQHDSERLLEFERNNGPIVIKASENDKLSPRVERFIDDMDEVVAVEAAAHRHYSTKQYDNVPTGNVLTEAAPVENSKASEPKPEQNLFHFEMLRQSKFYFLLLEGLAIIGISVFLVATPAYLTESHGWPVASAALVLTVHGCASLLCRALICALNAVPSVGERIPKTLQVGWGILCITAAASAYMLTPASNEPAAVPTGIQNSTQWNETQIETNVENSNTMIFVIFAAVNGMGEAFFVSYQASLLMNFMGGHRLTASLGYMTFVWGIAVSVFLPAVGIIGDTYDSLRYAYALGIGCCLLSFCSLLVAVKFHKLERRKQSR